MDLVDLVVHGIPALFDALMGFLLTRSLHMSPMALLGTVLVANGCAGFISRHSWRVSWALVVAVEWLVCTARGHRDLEQGFCSRCSKDPA